MQQEGHLCHGESIRTLFFVPTRPMLAIAKDHLGIFSGYWAAIKTNNWRYWSCVSSFCVNVLGNFFSVRGWYGIFLREPLSTNEPKLLIFHRLLASAGDDSWRTKTEAKAFNACVNREASESFIRGYFTSQCFCLFVSMMTWGYFTYIKTRVFCFRDVSNGMIQWRCQGNYLRWTRCRRRISWDRSVLTRSCRMCHWIQDLNWSWQCLRWFTWR